MTKKKEKEKEKEGYCSKRSCNTGKHKSGYNGTNVNRKRNSAGGLGKNAHITGKVGCE